MSTRQAGWPTHTEVSRLVADSIRASLEWDPGVRCAPFSMLLDAASDNPWRNYAVPDDGCAPSAAEVAALVGSFRGRGRIPRLEYVPAAAPAVEDALVAAGFVVEGRPPLMACRPGDIGEPAPIDGVSVLLVTGSADLLAVATAQNDAYGESDVEPEPAGPADVARMQGTIGRGGVIVLARDLATGEPVGGGQCSGPVDGVSELAAIGVRASHRRRGIAMAMTTILATAAHARGARLVWLEPAGEREAAAYAKVGFRASGSKIWISLR